MTHKYTLIQICNAHILTGTHMYIQTYTHIHIRKNTHNNYYYDILPFGLARQHRIVILALQGLRKEDPSSAWPT